MIATNVNGRDGIIIVVVIIIVTVSDISPAYFQWFNLVILSPEACDLRL